MWAESGRSETAPHTQGTRRTESRVASESERETVDPCRTAERTAFPHWSSE
jgi:hypothetical protein